VNNLLRFSRIPIDPSPYLIQAYPQSALVQTNRYQEQDLSHLIRLWQITNQQILHLWKNYSPTDLKKTVRLPEQDLDGDLEWWIFDYFEHLQHHLQQIFGSLALFAHFPKWQYQISEAKAQLAQENNQPFVTLFEHGSMLIEYYQPQQVDLQQPHRQDEIYVIASGQGTFFNNGQRTAFGPGDVLFVPAGLSHRFEDFSADFATWVIFYGPDGGEKNHSPHFETRKSIADVEYLISTDPNRLNLKTIHQFITHSYWGKGRSQATMEKALFHSFNFGLYGDGQQIGLARVITDFSTFAYLADVFVLNAFRGKGLGKWLIESILKAKQLQNIKNWLLFTEDAHGFYEPYGFRCTSRAQKVMERQLQPNLSKP
ncbi:MAG: GNAT family N-acetyltransferase, partial [Bacteroidota bacterium]